jgi:hypothetical protein
LVYVKTLRGSKYGGIFGGVEGLIGENFGNLKGGVR